jgi:hypothetical protein
MSDNMTPTIPQPTAPPKMKGKVELLAEIKKLLEKNGVNISDDTLLSLVDSMVIEGTKLSRRLENIQLAMIEPTEQRQKILVFPRGKHWIEKYQRWITWDNNFYNKIIENFTNSKLYSPFIDKQHQRDESYGEILEPSIEDEGLFFYIQLNPIGVELIRKKIYRYISPSIEDVEDLEKSKSGNWMDSISLTNTPALLGLIPKLQEQIQLSKKNHQRGRVMDIMELSRQDYTKLTSVLKLQDGADVNTMMKAITEIQASLQDALAKITALTGEGQAKDEQIAKQDEVMTKLNTDITKFTIEKREAEWETLHKEAITNSQWNPNEKFIELKKTQFMKDPDSIKMELSLIPKITIQGQQTIANNGQAMQLSRQEIDLLTQTGFDHNTMTPKQIEDWRSVVGEVK